jgi:hypothetical protein
MKWKLAFRRQFSQDELAQSGCEASTNMRLNQQASTIEYMTSNEIVLLCVGSLIAPAS